MSYPQYCGKGQSFEDGTYVYKCNACNGTNKVNGGECAWCYGLDMARVTMELKMGARGQRYYALLKAYLSVRGKVIADDFKRLKTAQGKVTPIDLGYLAIKYELNFKATCEWLEELSLIHSGAYEEIMRNIKKVSIIYDAAWDKYPELTGGKDGD